MKQFVIEIICVLVASACGAPQTILPPSRDSSTAAPYHLPSTSTAALPPAATPTMPSNQSEASSTPEPLQVVKRCPAEGNAPLSTLPISQDELLVLAPSGGLANKPPSSWHTISPSGDVSPFATAGFSTESPYSRVQISPDHRWLAFTTQNAQLAFTLWMFSFAGDKMSVNVPAPPHQEGEQVYSTWEWADSQTVVFYWATEGWAKTIRLNLFTSQQQEFGWLVAPAFYRIGKYQFSPDTTQILNMSGYYFPPTAIEITDIATGNSTTVFPWITSEDLWPDKVALTWNRNGLSAAWIDGDVIKIAYDDAPVSTQSGPSLEYRFYSDAQWYGWWSADSSLIALARQPRAAHANERLLVLNIKAATIYDNCISDDIFSIIPSADERFLALARNPLASRGTLILEIATGRRAYLTDWTMLGWGVR